jgi:hypothetical protein
MSLDKVWLAYVGYRPDPALPEKDRIALGCILETRMGKSRELAIAARARLTQPELNLMDGIGRRMLVQPGPFLLQELQRVLQKPINMRFEDGGVLRRLHQLHRWSLYVTSPRLVRIERHLSQTKSQALDTASEELFIAYMLGKEVPLSRPLRAKRIVPDDWRAQVPPAWQIAQSSVSAPVRLSM